MARKALSTPALNSYEQADDALRRIGELDRQIELSTAATDEAIDQVKQGHKAYCEPLLTQKADLERQLKEFAESRRADFASTRTRELMFGEIGFRRSSAVVIKKIGDTLTALKGLGLMQCVRVKEEIDKEAMRTLSDETLANVGAALVTKDAFGYEIKRELIPQVVAS